MAVKTGVLVELRARYFLDSSAPKMRIEFGSERRRRVRGMPFCWQIPQQRQ